MSIRVSYMEEEPEQPSGFFGHVARRLGRAARYILSEPEAEPEYPPVSEDAMVLARFILANTASERLKFVRAETPVDYDPTTVYDRGDLREYSQSERYSRSRAPRSAPHAFLTLCGRDYGSYEYPDSSNTFYCEFGVSYLYDGSRVIQAFPHEGKGPSYGYEYAGMHASVRELFGGEEIARDMEGYARINLGVLDRNGNHTPIRPYNTQAFGANLIPLLDIVSAPGLDRGLDIQVQPDDKKVMQFQ